MLLGFILKTNDHACISLALKPTPPDSNNSVVHMHDQKNMKKGLFFEAERESHLGVKLCLFLRKRVLLDSRGI